MLTYAYVLPHNSLSKVLAEFYVTTSLASGTPSLTPASVVISCVLMLTMGSKVLHYGKCRIKKAPLRGVTNSQNPTRLEIEGETEAGSSLA